MVSIGDGRDRGMVDDVGRPMGDATSLTTGAFPFHPMAGTGLCHMVPFCMDLCKGMVAFHMVSSGMGNRRSCHHMGMACLHTVSSRMGLFHMVPYHMVPYHMVPYHMVPYHMVPYHMGLFHMVPYHMGLFHMVPYHMGLFHMVPYHMVA